MPLIYKSRKCIGLLILTLAISPFLLYKVYHYKLKTSVVDYAKSTVIDSNTILLETKTSNDRLIDTPGCFLPRTAINPKHFTMKIDNRADCSFEKRLVSIDDTSETLQRIADENKEPCTVTEIKRHEKNDTFFYGDEIPLTEKLDISQKELFATKCGQYINFDAHFPINSKVQDKMDHWKENTEPPISVLFMGFDTASRSHYYRSLVKTLPLMQKMGFVDFKGYHSVAPSTSENFLAFLMGMTNPTVRASCAANWTTPFDKCPLIWNYFELNKYITMFIEDGGGSFNWGRQGGFAQKPTDYYPNPIFNSVPDLRHSDIENNRDNGQPKNMRDTCMSTMNVQTFILDYNLRFLKKFSNTPSFIFSWFAYPFHDSSYSLHSFDDQFLEFFRFLNSTEAKLIRENTLIILNADHGARTGDFIMTGYEGFIERSLPGLFIRLPERLLTQYPGLHLPQNFQLNSERLVGGFDIYQTLIHLLEIQGLNVVDKLEDLNSKENFEPVLRDRSSLFVPLSDQRTCDTINVRKGSCVCNTTSDSATINNEFFTNQLIRFGLKELNTIVNTSKYSRVCEIYRMPPEPLISASILGKTDKYSDTLLRFGTDQRKAQFEVQLRVFHEDLAFDHIERISPFQRLNRYGNSSWCVEFGTDEDKMMKAICNCKGEIPKDGN